MSTESATVTPRPRLEVAKREYDRLWATLNPDEQRQLAHHAQTLNSVTEAGSGADTPKGSNSHGSTALVAVSFYAVVSEVRHRFPVLCTLMMLQSASSFVLASFAALIERHVVVTLYLTMLVGAGGNAGNQSAVMMIRQIATRGYPENAVRIMAREGAVGVTLALALVAVGFIRVYLMQGSILAAASVCISLFLIVAVSVVVGAALPLMLHKLGYDPLHAGPSIQVVMDVLGVWVTCMVCQSLLDSGATHAIPELP